MLLQAEGGEEGNREDLILVGIDGLPILVGIGLPVHHDFLDRLSVDGDTAIIVFMPSEGAASLPRLMLRR